MTVPEPSLNSVYFVGSCQGRFRVATSLPVVNAGAAADVEASCAEARRENRPVPTTPARTTAQGGRGERLTHIFGRSRLLASGLQRRDESRDDETKATKKPLNSGAYFRNWGRVCDSSLLQAARTPDFQLCHWGQT